MLTFEEYAAWSRTAEKIAQAKAGFERRDANGDGTLDLREHLYRAADNDFWAADENEDCVVDLSEFRKRMSVEEEEGAVAKLERVFNTIDQNGDGSVSLMELESQPAKTRFQWFDLNQDAQLTREEFIGKLEDAEATAQAEERFKSRDKDGNGSLSMDEFSSGAN
jgi:Ca2+-binding EF-hand superfamily protein